MAMTKVKNLQLWCKKMADGYRDVEVRDMAASWKSGLAFCAIIHRFRPDLIDYESLSKENVFENNNLAFEVAEKELSIPAFLEAADMVAIRVPDRLSVVTYVSQYYNYFHNKPQEGGPGVNKFVTPSKRKDNKPSDSKSLTPVQNKADNPEIKKDRQLTIGDKCTICHGKVYLMERQIENAKLYHRRCFRNSELSPTSKVLKRQPYSPAVNKDDSQSSKFRKVETDTKKDASEKISDRLGFLKKDTESKPINKVEKDLDTSYKPSSTVSDVPAWKKVEKNKDISDKDKDKQLFKKTEENSKLKGSSSKPPPESKTNNLMNRFKELDERNLKSLSANESPSNKFSLQKADDKSSAVSKSSEPERKFPVPKPRQNLGKTFEKMDTCESVTNPTPSPRNQKSESVLPKKDNEVKNNAGFSRPKTPPSNKKSEFTLNLRKEKPIKDGSPSSPPPLPPCSPPKLPPSVDPNKSTDFNKKVSSPRFDTKHAQVSSPRSDPKSHNKTDFKVPLRPQNAPAKPPRLTDDRDRTPSPMDTSEPVPSMAVVHEPAEAPTAVLVVPKRYNPDEEKKDQQVLGGLLKTLANVRHKKDVTDTHISATGTDKKALDFKHKPISDNKEDIKVDLRTKTKDERTKFNKTTEKTEKPRPKTSFVSQSRGLFSDDAISNSESQGKPKLTTTTKTVITTTKTTTTTNTDNKSKASVDKHVDKSIAITIDNKEKVDDSVPEWKRKLEEKKREKARPKSADLLSDKNNSSSGGLLEWQKEAAKRKELRKGGYVDPEKGKVPDNTKDSDNNSKMSRPWSPPNKLTNEDTNKNTPKVTNGFSDRPAIQLTDKTKSPDRKFGDTQDKSKDKSPVLRKKIPFDNKPDNKPDKPQEDVSKKKIGLAQKFVFEDVQLKPTPKKPERPPVPAVSPTSPKITPSRPPPPKTSPFSPTKHHISTYQIQKQLRIIDERLTQLELKGRTLEDSIRNADDEKEDELMIGWFELINDKNELVRRECDLVYISKNQELELEQERIEQQLRQLVDKPAHQLTDSDMAQQEHLLEKKVELVYQRNKIVDSIDEDRIRYLAEDEEIQHMLQEKGFLKDGKDGKVQKGQKKKNKKSS